MRSDRLGETLLPKRLALPVFASDALSSVAYAPDEILLTLGLGRWRPRADPLVEDRPRGRRRDGRSSSSLPAERARLPLGRRRLRGGQRQPRAQGRAHRGQRAARRLRADRRRVGLLRRAERRVRVRRSCAGTRRSSRSLIVVAADGDEPARGARVRARPSPSRPTCSCSASSGWRSFGFYPRGCRRPAAGRERPTCSCSPEPGLRGARRARPGASSCCGRSPPGCAALTGVEAISNGVPAFRKPKSKNAATTLLLMGGIAVTMLISMMALSPLDRRQDRRGPRDPAHPRRRAGRRRPTSRTPSSARCRRRCSPASRSASSLVSIVTGLILVLAANTAFNGFPVLGSILARDGFLPRQLHTRGDRLAFSNGIIILAARRGRADRRLRRRGHPAHPALHRRRLRLVHAVSQIGMVRHWTRHLRLEREPAGARPHDAQPGHQQRRRGDVAAPCCVVVLADQVHPRRRLRDRGDGRALRRHDAHPPALRPGRATSCAVERGRHQAPAAALAGCTPSCWSPRSTSRRCGRSPTPGRPGPSILEALTVDVDPDETKALQAEWDRRDIPVPLKVLDSPYREITRPVVDYVKSIRSRQPARPRRRLHPRVRRRPLVGADPAQPERAAAARAGCCSPPASWSSSVPWQLASSAGHGGADGRPGRGRRPPRRGLMPRAPRTRPRGRRRGRGRRPADRPRRALHRPPRRARCSSCGTRCPASGCSPGSPRPVPASASCAPTPSRCSTAVARPGRRRRARGPAPGCAAAATCSTSRCTASARSRPTSCASSCPAGPPRASTSRSSRCPVTPTGLDWRTRVEFAVDAEGRAGLRRHRSHDVVAVDHCRIAAPGIDLLRVTEGAVARRRGGRRRRPVGR